MASVLLKLSSKTDARGRSQVIVKLTIDRTNRPCFKSGVWISPEWFKVSQADRGNKYEIVIPKKGKMNILEVSEAERAKASLEAYINRLTKVSQELKGNCEVTHESIEEAMSLTHNKAVEEITYQFIQDEKIKREQKQNEVENAKTFFEWMDLYLKKKEMSEGRKRGFRVLVRILSRYQDFIRSTDRKRKDFMLDVNTIDKETLEDFFDYMANEKALSEEYPELFKRLLLSYPVEFSPKHKNCVIEERGRNILIERKRSLKSFFNWMLKQGNTINRPFENITIGSEVYGTPFYLTLQERNTVADWDFSGNKYLERQRDIFIFQSLIGCRVSDLLKLTKDNIVHTDGVDAVQYIPRKTKDKKPVTATVPLNERAKRLVKKYKGVDTKGRLFPFISREKYNVAIKSILTICEIKRMVSVINPTTGEEEQRPINEIASSHMARRNFIGNLYKKVKDPNLIGDMSGHAEGSRSFSRYRDIDLEMKKDAVSLID